MSNARFNGETGNVVSQPSRGPSIDLQQRTLRVTNIHSNVTKEMLYELFNQAGPVVNVVHKSDFAFIEFEDEDSVGYSMALLKGVSMFGSELQMQPKLNRNEYFKYLNNMTQYEMTIACNPYEWWKRFGSPDNPMPNYLCKGAIRQQPIPPPVQQQVFIPYFPVQVQQNYQPQYPVHQISHSYEPYKNRYSLPIENHQNRGHYNTYETNGRYGDRFSPYSRPSENRYRDNRHSYSHSFNDRSHGDSHWSHRRSN